MRPLLIAIALAANTASVGLPQEVTEFSSDSLSLVADQANMLELVLLRRSFADAGELAVAGDFEESSEAALDSATAALIREGVVQLRAHVVMADMFRTAATALQLMSPEEAESVVMATQNAQKWLDIANMLIGVGLGSAVAFDGSDDLRGSLTVAFSLTSLFSRNRDRTTDEQTIDTLNRIAPKWLEQAHERASAVARHSMIVMELERLDATFDALVEDIEQLASTEPTNRSETRAYGQAYVAFLAAFDDFCARTLYEVQASVSMNAELSILTEDSQTQLGELATSVRRSRGAWVDARAVYAKSERVVTEYLASTVR